MNQYFSKVNYYFSFRNSMQQLRRARNPASLDRNEYGKSKKVSYTPFALQPLQNIIGRLFHSQLYIRIYRTAGISVVPLSTSAIRSMLDAIGNTLWSCICSFKEYQVAGESSIWSQNSMPGKRPERLERNTEV